MLVKETFMDLKTQLETVAKNHQASIQNLETKFDRLADKQSGRPSGSLPSNTQPNPRGSNSKAYQPPQARNEHVNVVFTRSGKTYNPPENPNEEQNKSENPINFDSDDEDDEPTPQPKIQTQKPVKETPLPKPYKPKIPDESSATIQNKVPPKLEDPESFLIPCNFNKIFSCNALAYLGASINLMPYSLYAKLSLETLKPTKMRVRLADRSFQYPVGIAEICSLERMPFGLCNAPATFQRCMLAIFHDMIEESVKVFMDDFSVFGNSFDKCLNNLDKMLQHCKDAHLVLNWEKCHFMVKEGIVLGHKVSSAGLEVDKAKIDVISKLSPPTNIKRC
ncbi:reverse transcriptase domain-containing protein [Tanacetum coccineum]